VEDFSLVDLEVSLEDAEKRALASSIATQKGDPFSLIDL
jgi:hypothetical protein